MTRRKAMIAAGGVAAVGVACFVILWVLPRVEKKPDPEWRPVRGTPEAPLRETSGIRHEDDYAYGRMRQQLAPLFCSDEGGGTQKEFVLDLYAQSSPYQLLVARIDSKGTLGEIIHDMDERIRNRKGGRSFFGTNEVFLVPNIQLDISHRFRDLEDSVIGLVQQRIQFRLDRSGAEAKSEAKHHVKPTARYFICDRPFLVVLRNRVMDTVIFALWVENAELLQPWR